MEDFLFNTFTWTVVGFVVAYVSHLYNLTGKEGGIISTIVFSLIGAFLGGMFATIFLGKLVAGISIPGVIVAGLALVLLVILQKIIIKKEKPYYDAFTTIP